ncbi:MAG: hypothetical protein WD766_11355 [Gemmatimonadota bacterium]
MTVSIRPPSRPGTLLALGVVALLVGCGSDEVPIDAAGLPRCRMAQDMATLSEQITEASGVGISRMNVGTVWTHNDSGGEPLLFAVDAAGRLQGAVEVAGAEMNDWEDLAIAACDGGDCLYIADIGDNDLGRSHVTLYRVREPLIGASETEGAERFEMRYPQGPRNAEAIFVLPQERVFIVTKGDQGPIELFAYPGDLRSDEMVELEPVRTLSNGAVPLVDRVTGASAAPSGEWVAIRTYTSVLFYRPEPLLEGTEVEPLSADLRIVGETQGEGVAFGENGAIVIVGEGSEGSFPGSIAVLWCGLPDG